MRFGKIGAYNASTASPHPASYPLYFPTKWMGCSIRVPTGSPDQIFSPEFQLNHRGSIGIPGVPASSFKSRIFFSSKITSFLRANFGWTIVVPWGSRKSAGPRIEFQTPNRLCWNHHQPPINHHETLINHDQTLINHDQALTKHNQALINHHQPPPVINHQSTIFSHDQPLIDHDQPLINHDQPLINHDVPLINHHQATIKHARPVIKHYRPLINQ